MLIIIIVGILYAGLMSLIIMAWKNKIETKEKNETQGN